MSDRARDGMRTDIPFCLSALAIPNLYGTTGEEHERHRRWWRNRLCHDLAVINCGTQNSYTAMSDPDLIAVAESAVAS